MTLATPDTGLDGIDFCWQLLHSDIINVTYILELIAHLNPYSIDYWERRQQILDTMIKDAELRSKAKLIHGFIQRMWMMIGTAPWLKKREHGTSDLEGPTRPDHHAAHACHQPAGSRRGLDPAVLTITFQNMMIPAKEKTWKLFRRLCKEKHSGVNQKTKDLDKNTTSRGRSSCIFSWEIMK